MISFEGQNVSGNISVFNIYIEKENNDFSGTAWNEYYGFAFDFHGVREMLQILENLFNHVNFPMATHEDRAFHRVKEKKHEVPDELYEMVQKQCGTREPQFRLHVQFRQNSTWQGTLEWVSMQKKKRFQSELDLIKLLIGALDESRHLKKV